MMDRKRESHSIWPASANTGTRPLAGCRLKGEMTEEAQHIAIAEVCGWTNFQGWWIRSDQLHDFHAGKAISNRPDYPHDLSAAIELCDSMAKEGWNCAMNNGTDTTWECEFSKGQETHYGAADKLAGAICMAFLTVKGLWTE